MEPTDEITVKFAIFLLHLTGMHAIKNYKMHGNSRKALRLKGGSPNDDKRYNDVPYLTAKRFKWDGNPCIDFDERVLSILRHGLGSMVQSGATLLQTVDC